jgi:hypothetical protein
MNGDAARTAPAGQPVAMTPPLTPGGVIARLTEILARQGLPLRRIAAARVERIAEPARCRGSD